MPRTLRRIIKPWTVGRRLSWSLTVTGVQGEVQPFRTDDRPRYPSDPSSVPLQSCNSIPYGRKEKKGWVQYTTHRRNVGPGHVLHPLLSVCSIGVKDKNVSRTRTDDPLSLFIHPLMSRHTGPETLCFLPGGSTLDFGFILEWSNPHLSRSCRSETSPDLRPHGTNPLGRTSKSISTSFWEHGLTKDSTKDPHLTDPVSRQQDKSQDNVPV